MTPRLNDELRQAVIDNGGAPFYVVDPATNESYVLMRADQFERIKALTEGSDVDELYPLLADPAPDDWEDLSQYDRKP
jgi:hypothetical protein